MKNRWQLMILLAFFALDAFATPSLGQAANNLLGPTVGLGKILNAICMVSGIGFLLGAIVQYKYHRENPQQVRLSTPITFLILGFALMSIPFVSMMSESGRLFR